jgi:hypothetical protein
MLCQHGKSLKEINIVEKTTVYRRCLVRIYFFNINSVQSELNQAQRQINKAYNAVIKSEHCVGPVATYTHQSPHENTQQIIYTNVGVILYDNSTRYRGKLRSFGTKGINYRQTQLEYITYFLLVTYFDPI